MISDRAKTAYVHSFLDGLKDPVAPTIETWQQCRELPAGQLVIDADGTLWRMARYGADTWMEHFNAEYVVKSDDTNGTRKNDPKLPLTLLGVVPVDPRRGDIGLLSDALQLVQELWPHPYSASVTLETHQWVKLRKVLLSIPDLLAEAER